MLMAVVPLQDDGWTKRLLLRSAICGSRFATVFDLCFAPIFAQPLLRLVSKKRGVLVCLHQIKGSFCTQAYVSSPPSLMESLKNDARATKSRSASDLLRVSPSRSATNRPIEKF